MKPIRLMSAAEQVAEHLRAEALRGGMGAELPFFMAAQQFLAEQGIRVPGEVSLLCTDASPDFHWCRPTVAHIRWDSRPLVRRVLQWAGNVSHGRKDLRQTFTRAEFVNGGTIGMVGRRISKTDDIL